jgi:hypothetical protein
MSAKDPQTVIPGLQAFQKRFPSLPEATPSEIIDLYDHVTRLSPSIVHYPHVLLAELRAHMASGEIAVADALDLLEFEERLRRRAAGTKDADDRLQKFSDQGAEPPAAQGGARPSSGSHSAAPFSPPPTVRS